MRLRLVLSAVLVLVLVLVVCGCDSPRAEVGPSGRLTPEELGVYSALVAEDLDRGFLGPLYLFDEASTEYEIPGGMYRKNPRVALDSTTMRDFAARQALRIPLRGTGIERGENVRWVASDELDAVFDSERASLFTLPWSFQGVIGLSPAGFNADRTQALVYVTLACPMCGHTAWYVLERSPGGRWRVVEKIPHAYS